MIERRKSIDNSSDKDPNYENKLDKIVKAV
jgi:hypothetical protein